MGKEGTYILKDIFDKPTANIILNGEKLKAFLVRSRIRQGCPLSHYFYSTQYWKKSYPKQSDKGKKKKEIQILKEKVKPSLFADDMILYIGNSRNAIKKTRTPLMNLVKSQDTKLIQISLMHFYTLTTSYNKEIKKTTSYLGVNLRN